MLESYISDLKDEEGGYAKEKNTKKNVEERIVLFKEK